MEVTPVNRNPVEGFADRHFERFNDRIEVNPDTECWEWQAGKTGDGYGILTIGNYPYYTHRLSYIMFVGELDEDEQVNHTCHNRKCVNPYHLYSGDQQDNIDDAVEIGTMTRGEEKGNSKLTKDDVAEIRRRAEDEQQKDLAEEFDVSKSHIHRIVHKKQWTHIE